jgi:uncharacterized protein YqeY
MSSLLEALQSDLKTSLKGGDRQRAAALRFLISQLQYARIEKQSDLDDAEVVDVLARQAKSRRESIEAFERAGRDDLLEKERFELEIITSYLPEQLSEEEIRSELARIVAEDGLEGMPDMGRLMGKAMESMRGRADGSLVSRLAKEILSAAD